MAINANVITIQEAAIPSGCRKITSRNVGGCGRTIGWECAEYDVQMMTAIVPKIVCPRWNAKYAMTKLTVMNKRRFAMSVNIIPNA